MKKKIAVILAAVLCLLAALAVAVSAENEPTTAIAAHNLALEDNIQIIYYVDFENLPEEAEKGVLIWKNPVEDYVYGTETEKLTVSTGTYGKYIKYNYTKVSAKMMSQDIYARSFVKVGDDITYGALDKYSVLQYCYNKRNSTTTVGDGTVTLGELVSGMLEYGAIAQNYFRYNTDRLADATYYQIRVENGTLSDGTRGGLFAEGENVKLYAQIENFCHWENSNGEAIGAENEVIVTISDIETYTATASHIEVIDPATVTCTEAGLTEGSHCSFCGRVLVAQEEAPAAGHNFGEWIAEVPATEFETGLKAHYNCAVCEKNFDAEYNEIDDLIIPQLESTFSVGLEFVSNGDGTCYVGDIGDCTDTEIVIPEESPDGETVTGIGQEAFSYCSDITSVYVPDSVTSIGNSAFYRCNKLTDITIGNGVENVGSNVFYNCPIENVTIHTNSISFIPKNNLKTVVIIGGTSIGNSAFSGCSSLTSIEIPSSVTSIGEGAFYSCSSLTSIEIPNSVTSIGGSAFSYCESLTSIEIPEGVTSIGNWAFGNCSSLTSITFAENSQLKSIGDDAFSGCSSLTSIEIPNSVTTIGSSAFSGCSSLKSMTVPFVGAKAGVTSSSTYQYPFGYIFGRNSYGGTATTQYYYGSSTSSTTSSTYYIPSSLKTVTVTGGYIPYGAFNCSGLTSITIGEGVTTIGSSAFSGCSSLTSIEIPNSVTSIGSGAFRGCSALTSVNIKDIAKWCKISFGSEANPLYYAHNLYLNGELVTELIIPEGVTIIGSSAFYGCSSLTSIEIPSSVTSIGSSAFYKCSSLTSIEIPSSVTSIGGYAFYCCSSLTSIEIPASVTSIGGSAFRGCSALTSIEIPEGVTSIGSSAFNACPIETATIPTNAISYIPTGKLKTVIINGGASIDSSTFSGCTALTSITIPTSVTNIGSNAFSGCSSLTSIVYQGTKSQWKAINKEAGWDDNMGDYTLYFEN